MKEALTVERNLRARAEIKEEQMRQEIIATTGQMHSMKDNFVKVDGSRNKEVEEKTKQLQAKLDKLEGTKDLANKAAEVGHDFWKIIIIRK